MEHLQRTLRHPKGGVSALSWVAEGGQFKHPISHIKRKKLPGQKARKAVRKRETKAGKGTVSIDDSVRPRQRGEPKIASVASQEGKGRRLLVRTAKGGALVKKKKKKKMHWARKEGQRTPSGRAGSPFGGVPDSKNQEGKMGLPFTYKRRKNTKNQESREFGLTALNTSGGVFEARRNQKAKQLVLG